MTAKNHWKFLKYSTLVELRLKWILAKNGEAKPPPLPSAVQESIYI